jgi:hypothetical protein
VPSRFLSFFGWVALVLALWCLSFCFPALSHSWSGFNGMRSMDLRVAVFHVMCEGPCVPLYSLPPFELWLSLAIFFHHVLIERFVLLAVEPSPLLNFNPWYCAGCGCCILGLAFFC